MKCLLIMTFIFINGIENAEHKGRQSGTILREDDLDSKTKAWLLMVESGKADDEHIRKITPKSIFIAPLLTSRSNKCKEGYRHDHLGQCVKVIKLDQKAQLELLLKRLSAIYSEKKPEEEGLTQISSGPLHFSLPISGADTTTKDELGQEDNSTVVPDNATTTLTPSKDSGAGDADGESDLLDSGTANEGNSTEGSGLEGSGLDSDDSCCNSTSESATLIPDDLDYTEAQETTTTELTSTEVPYTTDCTTDCYESATFAVSDSESNLKDILPLESGTTIEPSTVPPKERTEEQPSTTTTSTRVVFPDSFEYKPGHYRPGHQASNYPVWSTNYQYDLRQLPTQQLWWLPPNWRIDEELRKPAVFKFWSHLPLVHDPSFVGDIPDKARNTHVQSPLQAESSTRIPDGLTIELQQPLVGTHRRGRVYRSRRLSSDFIQPRSSYHVVRDRKASHNFRGLSRSSPFSPVPNVGQKVKHLPWKGYVKGALEIAGGEVLTRYGMKTEDLFRVDRPSVGVVDESNDLESRKSHSP